jgi:hypothetical protein
MENPEVIKTVTLRTPNDQLNVMDDGLYEITEVSDYMLNQEKWVTLVCYYYRSWILNAQVPSSSMNRLIGLIGYRDLLRNLHLKLRPLMFRIIALIYCLPFAKVLMTMSILTLPVCFIYFYYCIL